MFKGVQKGAQIIPWILKQPKPDKDSATIELLTGRIIKYSTANMLDRMAKVDAS